MNKFYKHSLDALFADSVQGDSEIFYSYYVKHYVPRIAHMALEQLNCSIRIWTMQGFKYRNKQSKHTCKRKTNSKDNCYK